MTPTLALEETTLIFFVVYGLQALWVYLIIRDVMRTRKAITTPVSLIWIPVAFITPFGLIAWIIHRRRLLAKERRLARDASASELEGRPRA